MLDSHPLDTLYIGVGLNAELAIHAEASDVEVQGGFATGSKVYVDGEEIAVIDSSNFPDCNFKFNGNATIGRVEKLIRALAFIDKSGSSNFTVSGFIELYLTDINDSTAYVSMTIGDTVLGTAARDVFTATGNVIGEGDEVDGGAEEDILQLAGDDYRGSFELHLMGKLAGVEIIQGRDKADTITIGQSQLADVRRIDGGDGSDLLVLYGPVVDLTNIEVANFEEIRIATNNAKIFVASVDIAKILDGLHALGGEVITASGSLTYAERLELHRKGIDKITTLSDSHTTVHRAPQIVAFGDHVGASTGETVFLDAGRDAVLDVDSGVLNSLSISVESGTASEQIGIDTSSTGISLSDGLNGGSKIAMSVTAPDGTVHIIEFGHINSWGGPGSSLSIKFNDKAQIEWVQQLIRSLTYTNSDTISGVRKVKLELVDIGERRTMIEVAVAAEASGPAPSENRVPERITLDNATVSENAADGTLIGIFSATDSDGDTLHYRLIDDASGRFAVQNGELIVKDRSKLDFEAASSHKITVEVSDGAATVNKDFTVSVTDVIEAVAGATKGKNVLIGSIGADRLNGGSGNDVLTGGAGADVFVFDSKLGTHKTDRKVNFDTITDFNAAEDVIHLDNRIFKKLKNGVLNKKNFALNKAKDKDDYIVYKNGVISYDADGKGKGKAVEIIKIANKAKLSADDFFVL